MSGPCADCAAAEWGGICPRHEAIAEERADPDVPPAEDDYESRLATDRYERAVTASW